MRPSQFAKAGMLAILAAIAPATFAQVSLTKLGPAHTESFDTLPASGSATWTNNSTIPGYHALYADDRTLPDCLEILSRNEIGVVMAVRHRQLPISAVQFHPESILSMRKSVGYRLIANVMTEIRKRR